MTDREIFEKETGIKLKPANGAGLLWQEYAEWQEKRSEWVSVELSKIISGWSEFSRHNYRDIFEDLEKLLPTPPDEAGRGRG